MIHKLGHTSELANVAITDIKLLDYIHAGYSIKTRLKTLMAVPKA